MRLIMNLIIVYKHLYRNRNVADQTYRRFLTPHATMVADKNEDNLQNFIYNIDQNENKGNVNSNFTGQNKL
jgi:hypothetical protein